MIDPLGQQTRVLTTASIWKVPSSETLLVRLITMPAFTPAASLRPPEAILPTCSPARSASNSIRRSGGGGTKDTFGVRLTI